MWQARPLESAPPQRRQAVRGVCRADADGADGAGASGHTARCPRRQLLQREHGNHAIARWHRARYGGGPRAQSVRGAPLALTRLHPCPTSAALLMPDYTCACPEDVSSLPAACRRPCPNSPTPPTPPPSALCSHLTMLLRIRVPCQRICSTPAARRIHLDLKPENVLIGPHDVPWITDFGLSTSTHQASM